MLQNMSTQAAPTLSISAIQAKRIEELGRAFMRVLAKKPTTLEKAAMKRAALLTARAELAAIDSSTSLEDVVRLDRLAHQARSAMFNLIGWPERRPPPAIRDMESSATEQIISALTMLEAEGQ